MREGGRGGGGMDGGGREGACEPVSTSWVPQAESLTPPDGRVPEGVDRGGAHLSPAGPQDAVVHRGPDRDVLSAIAPHQLRHLRRVPERLHLPVHAHTVSMMEWDSLCSVQDPQQPLLQLV